MITGTLNVDGLWVVLGALVIMQIAQLIFLMVLLVAQSRHMRDLAGVK